MPRERQATWRPPSERWGPTKWVGVAMWPHWLEEEKLLPREGSLRGTVKVAECPPVLESVF